jgi:hypothetical protein
MILVMLLKLLLSTFVQPIVTLHHRLVSFQFFFVLIFFLPLVPVGDFDIQKAVKRLRQTKSLGLDISGFIIKACSTILVPVFKNLSVSQQHLPM